MDNVQKSVCRLSAPTYQIDNLFRTSDYDWPGDWEGRALLAFCRLYSLTGEKIPAMDQMMEMLPEKTNADGFFGAKFQSDAVDEQQLSGHSWYLRGLVAYGELFPESAAMDFAQKTVQNLFLPALAQYKSYPVERCGDSTGGVSGNIGGRIGNWRLSTDVGCAFIPLDGLAHYYAATKDSTLKTPLETAITQFMKLDKVKLKMQTHATLTATRGILRFFEATGEKRYLDYAQETFQIYTDYGMTGTYENYNWFGRSQEEIWTEPCAVVDSLIVALELYRHTGAEVYKKLARRIWFNGLQFCQRINGGAGPNSCVDTSRPILKIGMYEAEFCCSRRYPEGLYWQQKYQHIFEWHSTQPEKENARYFVDDRLLVEDIYGCFPEEETFVVDGKTLILLPAGRDIPEETAKTVCFRVIF